MCASPGRSKVGLSEHTSGKINVSGFFVPGKIFTFNTFVSLRNPLPEHLIQASSIFSPFAYAYISITETDKRTDYLGKEIAIKTEYLWKQNYTLPINVVLGDEWHAGNLSYHLNSRPAWEGLITKDKLKSLSKFICIDNICVGNR